MNLVEISEDSRKLKSTSRSFFATVIEVTTDGIKLRIDGEDLPRETYYNSLAMVNIDDKVYINYVSGTVLVIGRLCYRNEVN